MYCAITGHRGVLGKYFISNSKNLKFENADHTENSWNKRLEIPLQFLFK